MERVYSRTWYIGEGRRFGKYKESSSRIWGEIKYRSMKIRKVGYSREKKRKTTRKVYGKDVI